MQDVQYSSLGLVLIAALATLDGILNALLDADDDDDVCGKLVTRVDHDSLMRGREGE